MQEDDQLTNSYFCGAEGVPEGESGIEKEAVKVTEVEERILKRGDLARIIGR